MLNYFSGLTWQNLFLTRAKPSVSLGGTLGQLSSMWYLSGLVALPGVPWHGRERVQSWAGAFHWLSLKIHVSLPLTCCMEPLASGPIQQP